MKILTCLLIMLSGISVVNEVSAQSSRRQSLEISRLTDDLYIYTTYKSFNGTPFPSNSMYLLTEEGVVMFDTPWDTSQLQPLLDSIASKHGKEVIMSLSTHSHDDRTGGIDQLKEKGVHTYTSRLTHELSVQQGGILADYHFEKDTIFTIGRQSFEVIYPGEGHTADNIVVWFKEARVLYGGCLVKSTEAADLGYTGEANLEAWPETIKKLKNSFPEPAYIVPGHQGWTSNKSLDHTLKLLREHRGQE